MTRQQNRMTLIHLRVAFFLIVTTSVSAGTRLVWNRPALAPVAALSISQQLPIGTHIDVQLSGKWVRADVSEDAGPSASTIKIRTQPDNSFMVVPRKSIRIAARPTSISVGDHFEWYDRSAFKYVPAFVKGIGTGSNAGSYLMAYDSAPNSGGMYSKPEYLWMPLGQTAAAPGASADLPAMGKYRCYAYSYPPNPPILLGGLDLRAGGNYSGHNAGGRDTDGRYSFDAASKTITWASGWMKTNNFGGKVESNAQFRIASTSICTHE